MTMEKVEIVLLSIFGLLAVATAKPQLPFLTFKDGNIGVNFGGYHAEAGLGGLLTGGRTAGGLHASAGTPFGANAEAGLGGLLDGHGYTGGQLHASAGLGEGNPSAVARIGGDLSGHGAQGSSFAGATAGGAGPSSAVLKSVETHSYGVPEPSVIGKTVETQVYQSVPNIQVVKTVDTHVSHSVPASLSSRFVETETLVPAQPNLVNIQHIEKVKTHVAPKKQKTTVLTTTKSRVNTVPYQSGIVVRKEFYPAPNWNVQKYVQTQVSPVQQVYYTNPGPASASASASAGISGSAGFYGGAYGGGYGGGYGGYGNNYYVKSQPSPQLYDDIFNIPISTLTAVNQLLRNKGK